MNKLVDRFPVKPIQASDIVPVRAGYQKCNPGFHFGPVVRDSFTIQYVYSGRGTVYKGSSKFTLGPTQIFILRPGETFRLQADILDPWTYIWIGFRTSLDLPELHQADVLSGKNLENLFLSIANCNKSSNRPLEPLLLSYTWKLLFSLQQLNGASDKFYRKAEEYVERACLLISTHYATTSVQQLADELHLNRSYLSRIFKESTGISIQTYLTNTRLQAARNLILRDYSVSQASTMVGYSDIASFSRAFKNYYKVSPKQYLHLNRERLSPPLPADAPEGDLGPLVPNTSLSDTEELS